MSDYRTAWLDLDAADARAAYAALHAASPQQSVFTSLAFADALAGAYALPGRIALVLDAGGEAAAGLVVYEKRVGPYRAAALPVYSKYVSPVLREPPRLGDVHRLRAPLDALLELLADRLHQVGLRLHPAHTDVRPFAWHGMEVWPEYQYDLGLGKASGDVTDTWRKDLRKAYRKERGAYAIDEGLPHLDAVLALEAASMGRKGIATAPTHRLRALARRLVAGSVADVLVARRLDTGEAEAGVVAPFDARVGYSWMMGSRPGPAMTVLLGALAERLRARGCARLCLGGANTPSVAEFKRGFDAELTPYFRARLVTRPEIRLRDAVLRLVGRG